MSLSIGAFVVTIVLSPKIKRYCKAQGYAGLENIYKWITIAAIVLIAIEAIFRTGIVTKWIWHICSIALIGFSLRQPELKKLRGTILAFLPFVVISVLEDLTKVINKQFFYKWEDIFDYAMLGSFILMLVVYVTQERQLKAAEKERVMRQHEDEINKAIAIRKTELEVLVQERTAELTQQKEALELTVTELQATQKQLVQSEKMASLGELTAGIAHEIQNPLNFVNNFSEINSELIVEMKEALDKGDIDEAKQIANDINDNEQKIIFHGKRADGIVKGMLQHSRSSTGVKEPIDINALADEYLRLSYHGLRAKNKSFNAKMETDFDQTIGKVNLVPQDMGRVILNLLNNAFYAVTEKKQALAVSNNADAFQPMVTIATKKIGNKIELQIADNGNGIPAAVLDKIFQPFFTTKPTGQGTGLGLSLSYDIVTKVHGGTLAAETKEGQGTTFIITLPA